MKIFNLKIDKCQSQRINHKTLFLNLNVSYDIKKIIINHLLSCLAQEGRVLF